MANTQMLHNDIIASSRTNRSVMPYHPSKPVTIQDKDVKRNTYLPELMIAWSVGLSWTFCTQIMNQLKVFCCLFEDWQLEWFGISHFTDPFRKKLDENQFILFRPMNSSWWRLFISRCLGAFGQVCLHCDSAKGSSWKFCHMHHASHTLWLSGKPQKRVMLPLSPGVTSGESRGLAFASNQLPYGAWTSLLKCFSSTLKHLGQEL